MVAAEVSRPVEISVAGLNQSCEGVLPVGACASPILAEIIQRGQHAARGDLEHRPTAGRISACAAKLGCPIKVTVGGLDQPGGVLAVRAPALRTETVQCSYLAGGDFEDRPCENALLGYAERRAVQIPIGCLDQRRLRTDVLRADAGGRAEII